MRALAAEIESCHARGAATLERIAANAVMAGCLPAHLHVRRCGRARPGQGLA